MNEDTKDLLISIAALLTAAGFAIVVGAILGAIIPNVTR